MSSKVKHVRNGHKIAVSRLFNTFEEIKTDEEAIDELNRVAAALDKKVSTLTGLNEKILEDLPDEEIETEIAETDEYMFNLDLKIHQIKKLINSRLSSLNVNTYVLNHNASSKSTSSTVDVNAQAPV